MNRKEYMKRYHMKNRKYKILLEWYILPRNIKENDIFQIRDYKYINEMKPY